MRKHWINMHLWVAAFFTPILSIIAISGEALPSGHQGNDSR